MAADDTNMSHVQKIKHTLLFNSLMRDRIFFKYIDIIYFIIIFNLPFPNPTFSVKLIYYFI